MPPKRVASARRKRSIRLEQVAAANVRLSKRRQALRSLNEIAKGLNLERLMVSAKDPDASALARLLRCLARREFEAAVAQKCRDAVRLFITHGGQLPEGLSLVEEDSGSGLSVPPEDLPVVPRHKVLANGFRLHSRAFMVTFNSTMFTLATWPDFKKWAKQFAGVHGARAWAACLEESLHASAEASAAQGTKRFHTHAYFIWTDDAGLSLKSLEELYFQDVRPRVDVCKGPGSAANFGTPRKPALHGLWYVTVLKEGKVESATNYKPWQHYSPCMAWLGSLWDEKKLSHQAFVKLSAEFRSGHAKRKRDAEAVMRQEQEFAVEQHVAAEIALLDQHEPLQPFRDFQQVTDFVNSFRRPLRRRPVLLFVGGTNSGKSLLAAHVLREVAAVVHAPSFVEVTVETDEVLDLSSYDHRRDAGVLFDGMGDTLTLLKHREVLQGRPKVCRGGRSATMVFSYPFTLARRAVVVTMDLTAKNLHLLKTNHWLKDSKNVSCVWLSGPSWAEASAAEERQVSKTDLLRAWSVSEVAAFFEARDASGLATVLQHNAVNGSDLFAWQDSQQVLDDLRVTKFAAQKIVSLRDAFLSS